MRVAFRAFHSYDLFHLMPERAIIALQTTPLLEIATLHGPLSMLLLWPFIIAVLATHRTAAIIAPALTVHIRLSLCCMLWLLHR